jgi:hypothetical protein
MKFVFIFLLLFSFVFSASAQEKRLDSAPQDFRTFYSKFKGLVRKNNKTAIAALAIFPFKYGFDTGDEGVINKAQFLKSYDKKFAGSLKESVNEENPVFTESKKGIYVVSTEEAAYLVFVRRNNAFKFLSFIVEP